jgi:hypothetical protein
VGNIKDKFNKRVDAFHRVIQYGPHMEAVNTEGSLTFKVPFRMARGLNKIQIIVRDNSTGKRFYVFDEYSVRGADPGELYMSSIAIFEEDIKPSSVDKYKMKVLDMGTETGFEGYRVVDPLKAFTGQPVFPIIDLKFDTQEKPVVFFTAGNFWMDEETEKVDFYIDYSLLDEESREIILPVIKERLIPVPGTKRINVLSQLNLEGLNAGEYKLRIRFLDQQKLQGVQRFLPITIR